MIMSSHVRLMIVDDDKLQRWSLKEKLTSTGEYVVTIYEDAERALEEFSPEKIDLVLLDIGLPGMNGLEALKEIHKIDPDLPVIMITADAQTATVVDCMRSGASDYVCKPFDFEQLGITLNKVWTGAKLRREVLMLRKEQERHQLEALVGNSKKVQLLKEEIAKIGRSDATSVLLQGESGTGKDLVAKLIHGCSKRRDLPFVAMNCAAIPETLIESNLFGYERGAFTDAKTMRKGFFEMAEKGTLLLDEIGEMPLSMQTRLLRVLEERNFRRLGGTQDIPCNVQVIASTNRDLDKAVAEGLFRQDLLYRLKVIPLTIPPLRERIEDLPILVEFFITKYNAEFHRDVRGVSDEALEILKAYRWPGNIRELRNVVERAIILGGDASITPDRLPSELINSQPQPDKEVSGLFKLPSTGISLQEVEKAFVQQALAMACDNQRQAARLLGLERDAFRRRLEKFSLKVTPE
jgi:two-component system, NtrC family, response regulator AtoC